MPSRLASLALAAALLVTFPAGAEAAFEDPGAAEPDAVVYAPSFSDVPEGHLFERSVRALLASGITRGCDEAGTAFCPDRPVTRGQMAAFLTRALDLAAGATTDFSDDDDSVFESDIERLAAAGVTRGCNPPDNTRFCPERPVSRAEMAAFLTRALPLDAPPAVPDGVELDRETTDVDGLSTRLTVCRGSETSLIVRSVTADPRAPGSWEPTSLELSAGEADLARDLWWLPASAGCEHLEVAWSPAAVDLAAPLDELVIVSGFGPRVHPILGGLRDHTGTDFRARTGDPVLASAPGVVIGAGRRGGYGNHVEIRHVGGLDTLYAHLSTIGVSIGDRVEAGDAIGAVGCTGLCTGPHLHFETLEFGTAVDPMSHLSSP